MKTISSKFSHGIASCIITLLSANCAHADDTEILFESSASNELTPNVLFILDNSGSMASTVKTETPYDNSVNYTQKAIDDGKSAYSDTYIYVYNSYYRYKGRILSSQNHCQTMVDKLAASGQYTSAKTAGFKKSSNSWKSLFGNSSGAQWVSGGWQNSNVIECKDDRGEHGKNGTTGNTYARNNNSMWTSNKSKEVSWGGYRTYDFFSANYQNWYKYYREPVSQSRISIMKNVITNLVNSTSGINIGLMSFNTDQGGKQGGRVTTPIGYIEDNRTAFNADLKSLSPDTWTPLSETLFEASRYYSGGSVFLGRGSVAASKDPSSSSKYNSPISDECQPNNVVLLTDGEPTYDAYRSGSSDSNDTASRSVIQKTVGSCSGNCLDEISRYMNENDISNEYDGEQTVTTYTIGFELDDDLLRRTAEGTDSHAGGGGKYYTANDTTELESAIKQIFSSLKDISTSFVSPGVAVNTFNRLNHRDELYFSVFKPESGPRWTGNLKRYRLGSDGIVYDLKDRAAIDEETGFFKGRSNTETDPGAWSWWSKEIDANDIQLGGAAENLPNNEADRNMFTYLGGSKNLTSAENKISSDNTAITKDMLNISSATDAERQQLLNWVRDLDVFDSDGDGSQTDTRHRLADPLHSSPVVVIYGGSDDDPDTTIFFGDNQGFLHAINGRSGTSSTYGQGEGEEYFAFMPDELLSNQAELMENSQSVSHIYGLDGSVSVWSHDSNNDLDLYDADDFVYVYTGMRRGGSNYYALDASDRNSPQFLWEIKGGPGGTNGYEELGQTWSKPVKTKIKMGNNIREVLIFGGGYDTNQDTNTTRSTDSIGRAVYIVDAETGDKIWSATGSNFSDMQYSIPSNVKAIDVNGDKIADQIYVGDMGGQLWRFDIDNENSSTNSLTVNGGVIARLSGTDTANNRRFYHTPDVSILRNDGQVNLAIVIGSGWQAHPLDTNVVDRLYLIKSSDVFEPPTNEDGAITYTTLTEEDLYDATENHLGDVSAQNTKDEQEAAYKEYFGYDDGEGNVVPPKEGWFIRLTRSGEKVLAPTLTVDGDVYYTTYEPKPNKSGCTFNPGISRLFHVALLDATPVKNYDGIGLDTELTVPDREVKILATQIPAPPKRLCIDNKCTICTGLENCEPPEGERPIIKTYWVQEE
jgi:type IV pilus assembly protein PilY1